MSPCWLSALVLASSSQSSQRHIHPGSHIHRQLERPSTAQTTILFSDIEGYYEKLEDMLSNARALGPNLEFHHLGDVFDAKMGQQDKQGNPKTFMNLLHLLEDYQVKYIVGNRDLNKLRFLYELHPKFLEYLRGLTTGEKIYVLYRLLFWTIHPLRLPQRLLIENPNDPGACLMAAISLLEGRPDAPYQDFVKFLAQRTMGAPPDPYDPHNFGLTDTASSKSIDEKFHDFFSRKNGEFAKILRTADAMSIVSSDIFAAHSGLGDTVLVMKGLEYDPYRHFGGLKKAVETLNAKMRFEIRRAFKYNNDDVEKLIVEFKIELRFLSERSEGENLEHAMRTVIGAFQKKDADDKWIEYHHSLQHYLPTVPEIKTKFQKLIVGKLSTDLDRSVESSIQSSVAYPLTKSFDTSNREYPSLTTNSPIGYYRFLLDELYSSSPDPQKV